MWKYISCKLFGYHGFILDVGPTCNLILWKTKISEMNKVAQNYRLCIWFILHQFYSDMFYRSRPNNSKCWKDMENQPIHAFTILKIKVNCLTLSKLQSRPYRVGPPCPLSMLVPIADCVLSCVLSYSQHSELCSEVPIADCVLSCVLSYSQHWVGGRGTNVLNVNGKCTGNRCIQR